MDTVAVGAIVTPGESVGVADQHNAGHGVYELNGALYASAVGRLQAAENKAAENDPKGVKTTLFVACATKSANESPLLPRIGAIVTARVTKVSSRSAHTELLVQDGRPLAEKFKGTIRQQDVRRTEIDKVDIYRCFAPGDLVRAKLLSLGDRHSYFLTTADNALGVVEALSVAGMPMVPISWQEMQCPRTGTREFRKVAKVDPKKPTPL